MKPVFKWVGGKTSSMERLFQLFDKSKEIYVEPFLGGGGSLLYVLSHVEETHYKKFIVGDSCQRLVSVFECIRSNSDELCDKLRGFERSVNSLTKDEYREYYYRTLRPSLSLCNDCVEGSATLITLLKMSFNGLYRVNSKNEFNTSIGTYKKLSFDYDNIKNVSKALKNVVLLPCDYRTMLGFITENCFVFLDPPYCNATKEPYQGKWDDNISNQDLVEFLVSCNGRLASVGMTNYVDFAEFIPSGYDYSSYKSTVRFQNNSGKDEIFVSNYLHKN